MGAAAVMSLAEVREKKQRAEGRQQLHERFAHWSDALEAQMKEPKPTLEQLTRTVWEQRQALTGSLTTAILEQRYGGEQAQRSAPWPQCGRTGAARAVVSRTVETLVGEGAVHRPYFYCVPGAPGFAPLEAALSLAEGRNQVDLQRAAAKLTAEVPYETAGELFAELTGVTMGRQPLHPATNVVPEGLGALDLAPPRSESEAKGTAVAVGHRPRPMLGLAIDGAQVPTRPETAQGSRPGRKQHRAKRARWP